MGMEALPFFYPIYYMSKHYIGVLTSQSIQRVYLNIVVIYGNLEELERPEKLLILKI